MANRRVSLPLSLSQVCGHICKPIAMGRERGFFVHTIDDTDYTGEIDYFGCTECEKAAKRRMRAQARRIHKSHQRRS